MPLSKSAAARTAIINALQGDFTRPADGIMSDDIEVIMRAVPMRSGTVRLKDSGTAARFLTAYFAATPGAEVILTGSDRLSERPITPLVDALRRCGATIEGDTLPLTIHGCRLEGGDITLPGNISSQFASALLLVAPTMARGLSLTLTGKTISASYIAMTLHYIAKALSPGNFTQPASLGHIEIKPAPYTRLLQPLADGDWSAASYFLETAAINRCDIDFTNMSADSAQPDVAILSLIADREPQLDLIDNPDLAPTLAATRCAIGTPFRFTGLDTLPVKECNRLEVLSSELKAIGYNVETDGVATLSWDGTTLPRSCHPVINPHGDHRIAMALAPLASKTGSIAISNPEVVTKSFPGYWDCLAKCGYSISW